MLSGHFPTSDFSSDSFHSAFVSRPSAQSSTIAPAGQSDLFSPCPNVRAAGGPRHPKAKSVVGENGVSVRLPRSPSIYRMSSCRQRRPMSQSTCCASGEDRWFRWTSDWRTSRRFDRGSRRILRAEPRELKWVGYRQRRGLAGGIGTSGDAAHTIRSVTWRITTNGSCPSMGRRLHQLRTAHDDDGRTAPPEQTPVNCARRGQFPSFRRRLEHSSR